MPQSHVQARADGSRTSPGSKQNITGATQLIRQSGDDPRGPASRGPAAGPDTDLDLLTPGVYGPQHPASGLVLQTMPQLSDACTKQSPGASARVGVPGLQRARRPVARGSSPDACAHRPCVLCIMPHEAETAQAAFHGRFPLVPSEAAPPPPTGTSGHFHFAHNSRRTSPLEFMEGGGLHHPLRSALIVDHL